MILWGVRTMAPVVPPGVYAVRLTGGGDGREHRGGGRAEPVDHGRDGRGPDRAVRVRGADPGQGGPTANTAVIEIREVKAELEERLAASEDEGLGEAGERLRVAASEVEGEIYQVRNRSNQDPLNFPIKVNNRLANLLSMSERGDGRPGEWDVRGVRDHGGEVGGAA